MITVIRTFSVTTPIDQVVTYLADFANAQAWDPGTQSCRPIGAGPVAVGSTWHNVSTFRGKQTELTYRLVRRNADRLTFEGKNKSATSTDDLTFVAAPIGGTTITYRADIRFSGLIRLVGWVAQREFNKLDDQTAEQMTRVLNAL